MGLTKQYLRYLPHSQYGVIGSGRCNVVFLNLRSTSCRYVAAGACEHVNVWDMRTMEKVMVLKGDKHEVTVLTKSPDKHHLAVGYTDGSVRIFSLMTSEMMVTYNGHRSAVSCLAYDKQGMRLVSGSNDTEVVVWDLVNESGLYRLRGHKGQITGCCFIKQRNMLVTSSKDTFVKWWDLDTQHCFKTMVGHRAEVWDFVITPDETKLITGSSDSELRIWSVEFSSLNDNDEPLPKQNKLESDEEKNLSDASDDETEHQVICKKLGSVMRQESDRVMSMFMTQDGHYIACHGNSRIVEVFKVRTDEEIRTHMKRKAKKARRQQQSKEHKEDEDIPCQAECTAEDTMVHVGKCKFIGKIKNSDIVNSEGKLQILSLLLNNQMEIQCSELQLDKLQFSTSTQMSLHSHRKECKSACFTSDGMAILTVSADSAKLWNRVSQKCIITCPTDQGVCCMFAPGNRQFIVGTKTGKLEIHDIASGKCIERTECHSESIKSLAMYPDQRGFVTCSSDKTVKFWEFDLILDEEFSSNTKRLTVSHTRTLQMDDEVVSVVFSPNKKLLACALMDCSVKVFYVDTLKFFLSLYGHSLPVACMSIADDSTIIATGSSDRSVKLWGLDFGDCHKSLFAHDDSITSVKFLPDTHLLFSCGKDGLIKQWDADKFIHIQTLEGHHGPVWCLATDPEGDYVASCGADRSIRMWTRSNEVVIPDEERERLREKEDENRIVKNLEMAIPGESQENATGLASRATIETVKGAERIMEAIEIHREESLKLKELEPSSRTATSNPSNPKPHPILQAFGNISSKRYVLEVIKKVKSSELEESLLVLPFSYVIDLLHLLNDYVRSGWQVELVCRCLFFLLKVHHGVIMSNQMLVSVLENLQQVTESKVKELQDVIGFNLAAMGQFKREMENKREVTFFADATAKFKQKNRKRKKKLQHEVIAL